jgi:Ca-activated chloride channel family protein
MTRWLPGGALAACIAGMLETTRPDQPSIDATSGVMPVFVTVTDRDGRLVSTLTRDDFELFDEGERQPLAQFSNTPQPLRLIVMLDVSSRMEPHLAFVRMAAAQLFALLRPDDLTLVGTFGREIAINSWFTQHAETLRASLPSTIAPDAARPLWRALDEALDAFGEARDARRAILVLTDGMDRDPLYASAAERRVDETDLLDRLRHDDVMIYAIGIRGGATVEPQAAEDAPDPGLARVADETGGRYTEVRLASELRDAFAAVARELHAQYLLGFAPRARDGRLHDISVRAAGGMQVRARRSYLAPKG